MKQDKYEREGYKAERQDGNKDIDCTDNYKEAIKIIKD